MKNAMRTIKAIVAYAAGAAMLWESMKMIDKNTEYNEYHKMGINTLLGIIYGSLVRHYLKKLYK